MPSELQPYVGPRPFEREERQRFFGRERESSELLSRVIAHPAVLLYSQSGAGKTSLLNASLIPLLESEGFEILPAARVRGLTPKDIAAADIPNLYVFNVLMSWSGGTIGPKLLAKMSIADFLNSAERPLGREGMPAPRVAVFDQFEELFTFYPERWNDRQNFFEQVSEALERDRLMRIIFVMREDYIAELDPFVSVLPEKLRTRFRLERLREEAALEAVTEPLDGTGYSFAGGVAEQLVNNLLEVPVETAAGVATVVGEFVEPVQLQVVCQTLWQKLDHSGSREITLDQLKAFGDVDLALSHFYETAIVTVSRETGVNEGLLRRWFEHTLITSSGTRGTVFRGREETGGIPNAAVDKLVDQHLIRGELRGGARWYELTHDRLIDPIISSNHQWMIQKSGAEETRQRLEKRAAEWVHNGRPRSGLLDEAELLEARRWLESPNAEDVGYSEALFALVQASRAAVEEVERQRERVLAAEQQRRAEAEHARVEEQQRHIEEQGRGAKRLRRLVAALAVMFLLAIVTAVYAVNRSRVATSETQRAQQKEREANALLAAVQREKDRANEQTAKANEAKLAADEQRLLAQAAEKEAEKQAQIAAEQKNAAEKNAKAATEVAILRAEADARRAREKEAGLQRATELENSALRFEQNGEIGAAIEEFNAAASQYEILGKSKEEMETLFHIAQLHQGRKEYPEAERAYTRAVEIKKIFGFDSVDLNKEGNFYFEIGDYDRAEGFYQQAIAAREKQYSREDDVGLAVMYRNLANVYRKRHNGEKPRYSQAEQLCQQALRIHEKVLKPDDRTLVRTLFDCANTYLEAGRYIDAEPLFEKVLSSYGPTKDSDHPDGELARRLQGLASLYSDLGKYPKAVAVLAREIEIQEMLLYQWPAQPNFRPSDLAVTLNQQGLINYYQGNYAKAEELYERALDIDRKQLEPSNTEIATMRHNLALTYFKEARYVESEQYEKEALAIRGESGDLDRLATSHSVLARLYSAQGKYAEAESFYKRVIDERIEALGADHPDLAIDQHYLAEFYVTQGRLAEARKIEEAAITVLEKSLGPANWRTSASLSTLATIYTAQAAQGKGPEAERLYREAENLYKQALYNLEQTFGENHPEIAISLNGLARLYMAQRRHTEAEPLLKRAQQIQEKMLNPDHRPKPDHPDLATTLNNYGLLYSSKEEKEKYAEAEQFYMQALEIRQNKLGKEHPAVAETLENYAALLRKTNRETEAVQMEARAKAIRAKYPQVGPDN